METHYKEVAEESVDNSTQAGHYQLPCGIEVLDIIRKTLTDEQFKGFCLGNVIKYRMRAGKKGPAESDLIKAKHYEDICNGL